MIITISFYDLSIIAMSFYQIDAELLCHSIALKVNCIAEQKRNKELYEFHRTSYLKATTPWFGKLVIMN